MLHASKLWAGGPEWERYASVADLARRVRRLVAGQGALTTRVMQITTTDFHGIGVEIRTEHSDAVAYAVVGEPELEGETQDVLLTSQLEALASGRAA